MTNNEGSFFGSVERKTAIVVVIILAIILLAAGADYKGRVDIFILKPPYTVPDVFSMLNILVSLLLTYFLVTLYNQQSSILGTQTEIQEAEQEPILRVDSIEPTEDEWYGYELGLSNVGKGVALDIRLVLELEFDPELEVRSKNAEWKIHREEEFDKGIILTSTNYLKAGETKISSKARHALFVDEDPEELTAPKPFEDVTELLADCDPPVEFQRMKMALSYEDNLGNKYTEEFADIVFPIKGKTGFLPALEHSVTYEEYEDMREVAVQKRNELEFDSAVVVDPDTDVE